MNILFISNLTGNLWAGPNNSVPAQVLAQAKIDNVMWVNLNHNCLPNWKREEYIFANYDQYPNCTLSDLPAPFNKPDFIVCEEIYCYRPFDKMIVSVINSGIPYSIIPRSSLTLMGQKNHALKKKIANIIFYNRYIKRSKAIQYLTKYEESESKKMFSQPSFVIPNGTNLPVIESKDFCRDGIKATYIGRVEIYQKGLDLLVEVINSIKEKLRDKGFSMDLYGPNRDNTVEILSEKIKEYGIGDLLRFKDAVFAEQKAKILRNTDVFIMTSRFEGLPMGLIEALGYGVPCLATEGTFLMDEIEKYNAGWAAGTDEESIKEAFNRMLDELDSFSHKSKNAVELAKHYSWDFLASQLHEKIESFI